MIPLRMAAWIKYAIVVLLMVAVSTVAPQQSLTVHAANGGVIQASALESDAVGSSEHDIKSTQPDLGADQGEMADCGKSDTNSGCCSVHCAAVAVMSIPDESIVPSGDGRRLTKRNDDLYSAILSEDRKPPRAI